MDAIVGRGSYLFPDYICLRQGRASRALFVAAVQHFGMQTLGEE